jgi:hypothetical protein
MAETTWAVYQRFNHQPARVLYSHLTEKQASNEAYRLNSHCADRGLPAGAWAEPHHPGCVFVIG